MNGVSAFLFGDRVRERSLPQIFYIILGLYDIIYPVLMFIVLRHNDIAQTFSPKRVCEGKVMSGK